MALRLGMMTTRLTLVWGFAVCILVVLCMIIVEDVRDTEQTQKGHFIPASAQLLRDKENRLSNTSSDIVKSDATVFPLVLKDLDTCLESSNLMKVEGIEAQAKTNALDFYTFLRQVIPQEFSSTYASPCWDSYFSIARSTDERGGMQVKFQDSNGEFMFTQNVSPSKGLFQSTHRLLCLPKVFLAGYPKCGSTYLWCVMNKLLIEHGVNNKVPALNKEPDWWIPVGIHTRSCHYPIIDNFGKYFLNFIAGLEDMEIQGNNKAILMDGSPNLMFNWPRFCNEKELDMANYCLLPSLLPHLIPSSKFVVVMRNPVDVLYSAFWFSCTTFRIPIPRKTQLQAPDIFHQRILQKINHFTSCMTEESGPLSKPCTVDSDFGICIKKRLHLLDRCVHEITYDIFSGEMNRCGRSRVELVLYYAHTRRWLSVVPQEKFLFLQLEELITNPEKVAEGIQDFLLVPRQSINLQKITHSCRENTQLIIDYRHDPLLGMRNDTRMLLQTFYEPFNEKLAELLGDSKFLWKNH